MINKKHYFNCNFSIQFTSPKDEIIFKNYELGSQKSLSLENQFPIFESYEATQEEHDYFKKVLDYNNSIQN